MTYARISIDQAKDLIQSEEVTILDIRDPESYMQGHIEESIHVSNSNVEEIIKEKGKTKPLIIYCYHGNSSQGAAEYFSSMGFERSYSVDGGFEDWKLTLAGR